MSPNPHPAEEAPDATKMKLWARARRSCPSAARSREICKQSAPSPKMIRELFASIGHGSCAPSEALAHRARHLADARLHALSSDAQRHQLQQERAIYTAHSPPILDLPSACAMATLGPPPPSSRDLPKTAVGSLGPHQPPEDLFALFLQRRGRKDWAATLRREHPGALFSDPLLLSMARIVPPAELPAALQDLLAVAVLCACPDSARAALALGARADAEFSLEALGSPRHHRKMSPDSFPASANLLGLALLGSGQSTLSLSYPGAFFNQDDHIILGSAAVALGAAPSSDPAPMLSLRLPERGPARADAMGLALSLRLVRCARHFLALGMDPLAASCGPRESRSAAAAYRFTSHPLRLEAIAQIYADGESRALATHLAESIGGGASPRLAPRL